MGKYLDIAASVIAGQDSDNQCEISELSEISPQSETWGAAAATTKIVLLHCPPGVPEAWAQGVADLLAVAPPTSYPSERWMVVREDAYRFLSGWAAKAHWTGWTDFDVFGVHRNRPQVRLDCMGLVPLLLGREVAELSKDQAAIKIAKDQTLTYRRKIGPRPDETCLLWELGQ